MGLAIPSESSFLLLRESLARRLNFFVGLPKIFELHSVTARYQSVMTTEVIFKLPQQFLLRFQSEDVFLPLNRAYGIRVTVLSLFLFYPVESDSFLHGMEASQQFGYQKATFTLVSLVWHNFHHPIAPLIPLSPL